LLGVAAELLFYLSGQNPHAPASASFIILTAIYGFFVAALAGFVAARIAGRLALFHGALLACLVAIIALLSLLADLGTGSIWSQLVALLFMAPAVTIGAMMRLKKTDENPRNAVQQ
jgi:hypothetical protein